MDASTPFLFPITKEDLKFFFHIHTDDYPWGKFYDKFISLRKIPISNFFVFDFQTWLNNLARHINKKFIKRRNSSQPSLTFQHRPYKTLNNPFSLSIYFSRRQNYMFILRVLGLSQSFISLNLYIHRLLHNRKR